MTNLVKADGNQIQEPEHEIIDKAVIPAAGLGSRMLPITKSIPKEMLTVGRKPMIQHIVEEAVASGLRQICIIIREGKEVIRDYFCQRYSWSSEHTSELDQLEALVTRCEFTFVYQSQPLGLGDAILQAREFVGTDSFVMMIPDQLFQSDISATQQLLSYWQPGLAIWSSIIKLPKIELSYFAGARGFKTEASSDNRQFTISRICSPEETRQQHLALDYELRGFGRTIYPPAIFDYLGSDFINPQTGEVDLLRTFEDCAKEIPHFGVLLDGQALDLGTFPGYYRYLPRLWEASE